jgi:HPt (histidine-containing phosphotransfer) domain-containing protein
MRFDRAHFAHMTGDDSALQAEVLGLFRAQAEGWRAALDPAHGAWRATVHTIKGSARGVGFWELAEACERAERAEGEGASEALNALKAALAQALAAAAA